MSVKLDIPDEMKVGVYANFLTVGHSPWDYVLTFCHIRPPDEDDVKAGEVRAKCVATIVISSALIDKVIEALAQSRDKLSQEQEAGSSDDEDA